MNRQIEEIIQKLDLKPHPEGGYFKETYRSPGEIELGNLPDKYSGNRNYSTCIYFLLISGNFSAFHKINQDEIWHFYDGSPVELHTISQHGEHQAYIIGRDFDQGQTPQLAVPGNHYFASKVTEPNNFSLVGCTVAPGFDFDDFVLARRGDLLQKFPQHQQLVIDFTHDD